jgi:hypothetical protein
MPMQTEQLPSPGFFALFRSWSFQPKDRFAFFHHIEPITRDRFQISRIRFQQTDLASLSRQQSFLIAHLGEKIINFSATAGKLFVRRNEQTDNYQPHCDAEKNSENPV